MKPINSSSYFAKENSILISWNDKDNHKNLDVISLGDKRIINNSSVPFITKCKKLQLELKVVHLLRIFIV